jgi:hypothetical protein
MQPNLTHVLDRTRLIRRQLEREKCQSRASPSRLLRMQALLLRAQLRLAELIEQSAPRPALVPVRIARSAARTSNTV